MHRARRVNIHGEIARARVLHEQWGARLMADPRVFDLLGKYHAAIEMTGETMKETGIGRACAACAARPHGSCCFPEIEEGFDHVLLLINLLLGCPVPDAGEVPGSCVFLGEQGCRLLARTYYCVHFLCPGLREMLGPTAVEVLLRLVGEEIHAGWELEKLLRSWLLTHGSPSSL